MEKEPKKPYKRSWEHFISWFSCFLMLCLSCYLVTMQGRQAITQNELKARLRVVENILTGGKTEGNEQNVDSLQSAKAKNKEISKFDSGIWRELETKLQFYEAVSKRSNLATRLLQKRVGVLEESLRSSLQLNEILENANSTTKKRSKRSFGPNKESRQKPWKIHGPVSLVVSGNRTACTIITIAGPPGEKGQCGERGPAGERGPPGERGQSGVRGRPGKAGPRGIKGEKGDTGKTGPRGALGQKGAKGEGRKGNAGPMGPRGRQGQKGQKGARGERGISVAAPKITLAPVSVTVLSTGRATFTCRATGNPKPTVSLVRKGKKMDGRYETVGEGNLAIKNVMLTDRGAIECVAKSVLGEDRKTAYLNVKSIYHSCKEIFDAKPDARSGVYELRSGRHFCAMSDMRVCNEAGWTLAMKIDGTKATFKASSSYWTHDNVYNVEKGLRSFTNEEAKFAGFNKIKFQSICVGMRVKGAMKSIKTGISSSSLLQVFKAGTYKRTSFGRSTWLSLISGSHLQPHCNREGFNVQNSGRIYARIGIIGNNENECYSPDSILGLGTWYTQFCLRGKGRLATSCGNLASCSRKNQLIPAMGFIFIK